MFGWSLSDHYYIIILFIILVKSIISPFVCRVNASLEVFRPGILTPYFHSVLLKQIYSAGYNSPRQAKLLPLHVPRSNWWWVWRRVPSRHAHMSMRIHHVQVATQITDTQGTHTNRQHNGLSPLSSLDGQDEGPLVRIYMRTCTRWVLPATGLSHWVCHSFHSWTTGLTLSWDSPGQGRPSSIISFLRTPWFEVLVPLCPSRFVQMGLWWLLWWAWE